MKFEAGDVLRDKHNKYYEIKILQLLPSMDCYKVEDCCGIVCFRAQDVDEDFEPLEPKEQVDLYFQ